jgi:hypothetical protein
MLKFTDIDMQDCLVLIGLREYTGTESCFSVIGVR